MKKFSLLACLMTVTAGFAVAQTTISIPFFADNNNSQAFVGLQNVGPASIVVGVNYLDVNGLNGASGGTFTLTPGQSISYQPGATTGSEIQAPGLNDAPVSYGGLGSITFDIPAGGVVTGRYVQISANGSFAHNLAAGQ